MPCRSASARKARRNAEGADEAALAQDGLDDERGDALRRDARFEQFGDRRERALGIVAAARVGKRRVVDLGNERSEVLLVRQHLAAERRREQRAAVKAEREADDRGASGRPGARS
jgi:hypothetical protein